MFSIDINDKTKYSLEIKEDYWLEYSETIEKIINWEIINKYKNKLPISLQNEITTKGYYKNISFSNNVDDNAINDFKTKINKMKNEWKLIKINPLGFINFNEIHNNDIINRIQIIHTIFSFLNNHNKILSPDILDNKKSNNTEREYDGEWFFLEQFFIERKSNKKDSIRIFHCARIEKSIEDSDIKEIKITIFPLFIDTKLIGGIIGSFFGLQFSLYSLILNIKLSPLLLKILIN